MHREIPPQPQAEDEVEEVALAADVDAQLADEWKARYASWCHKTYVDTSSFTPTAKTTTCTTSHSLSHDQRAIRDHAGELR